MAKPRAARNISTPSPKVNLRKLRTELKLIPNDIRREMRYLDLLLSEKNSSRTEVEKNLLKDLIDGAKKKVKAHQDRLWRFERCQEQMKERKTFDMKLLTPDEFELLKKAPTPRKSRQKVVSDRGRRRTGTDG